MRVDDIAAEARRRVALNTRRLRRAAQKTQEQLAAECGLGWRHLQKIEAGDVNVTLRTLAQLAFVLLVDPVEFLRPGEDNGPEA